LFSDLTSHLKAGGGLGTDGFQLGVDLIDTRPHVVEIRVGVTVTNAALRGGKRQGNGSLVNSTTRHEFGSQRAGISTGSNFFWLSMFDCVHLLWSSFIYAIRRKTEIKLRAEKQKKKRKRSRVFPETCLPPQKNEGIGRSESMTRF